MTGFTHESLHGANQRALLMPPIVLDSTKIAREFSTKGLSLFMMRFISHGKKNLYNLSVPMSWSLCHDEPSFLKTIIIMHLQSFFINIYTNSNKLIDNCLIDISFLKPLLSKQRPDFMLAH